MVLEGLKFGFGIWLGLLSLSAVVLSLLFACNLLRGATRISHFVDRQKQPERAILFARSSVRHRKSAAHIRTTVLLLQTKAPGGQYIYELLEE